MRIPLDERFRAERARYALRHCCEDCGFFDASTNACRHFWPNAEHRLDYYEGRTAGEIVFCKEFELE